MSPLLLAALINNIAIPEIGRWLAQLHDENRQVTDEEALKKLGVDADTGDQDGYAFLGRTGG